MALPPRERARPNRSSARVASLAAVLALACVASTLVGGTAAATQTLGPRTPPVSTSLGAASAFSSRAGFSAASLAELVGPHPATGTLPVDVTFTHPLSRAAYAAAIAYFTGEGLRITQAVPNHLSVLLEGPAPAVGTAFATDLVAGRYNGSLAVAPSEPPALPAWLQTEVAGVVGLSSGFTHFQFALGTPATAATVSPGLARDYYGISSLYNLSPSGDPHPAATYPVGLSVAVVLWGEGVAPNDIGTFITDYYPSSFPSPNIVYWPIAGAPEPSQSALSSPDLRAVEELTLDTEWAMSMAPGATINVVYAPDGPASAGYSPSAANLTAAVAYAVSLDPAVISMSFGTTESTDGSLVGAWSSLFQAAQTNRTTVLAATGDSAGDTNDSNGCSGTPAPEYPASSPSVLAVGGTMVNVVSSPLSGTTYSETAWNSSGGGFSTQFAAPKWQEVGSANATISANGHRGMPDVSATAADNELYFDGRAGTAGGTSFATPLWAGLVADIDAQWGQRLGFFTPNLYHVGWKETTGTIGTGLVNVSGGANCVATATPGWNEVTGWGSPRAAILYDDLLGSFVNITLELSQTTLAPGGSVSVNAHLTNRTNGADIAGVPLTLSLASDTDLGPCTGTFDSTSPTTNSTGWAAGTLSVPLCYLGQHALLNASVTTTKLYGSSGARLDVNLLGFDPALSVLSQPPWAYVTYSGIVGAAAVLGAWIGRPKEPAWPPRPPAGAVASAPARPAVTPAPSPPSSPAPSPPPPPPPAPSAPPPSPSPSPWPGPPSSPPPPPAPPTSGGTARGPAPGRGGGQPR